MFKSNDIEREITIKENDFIRREREISILKKNTIMHNKKCLEEVKHNETLKSNLIQSQYYSVISMMMITFFFNYQSILGFLLD